MNSGAGFYKYQDNELYHGPNFVVHKDFQLYKENYQDYSYPIDGWYWFDSREHAESFFNIPSTNPDENG